MGAAVGVVAGIIYTAITEHVEYKGKSAKDWAKHGLYEAIN
ncbi:MAG: hypothetical protein VB106_16585 [Clostridiaceae bacterium]|nr:hypothetical protein [Clostridiaceae bacterium]